MPSAADERWARDSVGLAGRAVVGLTIHVAVAALAALEARSLASARPAGSAGPVALAARSVLLILAPVGLRLLMIGQLPVTRSQLDSPQDEVRLPAAAGPKGSKIGCAITSRYFDR